MLSRRRFLVWISSALPVAIVARRADALAAAWIVDDAATLRALAEAILPSELGREGAAAVARDFQRWIEGYRGNAELVHGYGTSALRFARPSPRARWAAQLSELRDVAAQPIERRRSAVRRVLERERLDRMPDVASAPHVTVALLAFYYGTSGASDLCYQARIGREQCRPLTQSSRKQLPMARGVGA
ncbi:MAG TPA: hypothetical protein VFT29_02980 [Gemmatimonadaceae bacterium]|nr:hypothetical protein [Gemmatimonadaceae bacterium]